MWKVAQWILPACLTIGLAIWIAVAPWEAAGAPVFTVAIAGTGLVLFAVWDSEKMERRFVAGLIGASILVHAAAAIVYSWATGGSQDFLYNDPIAYDRTGWLLAQQWQGGWVEGGGLGSLAWVADEVFAKLVAGWYFLVGHSPAAIIGWNIVFGAAGVYLSYRIASVILGPVTGRFAGWFVLLYTGFWINSLMMLKDGLMLVLILLAFHAFYRFWHILMNIRFFPRTTTGGILWLVLLVLSIAGVFLLRDYVAKVLGAALLVLPAVWSIRTWRWTGAGLIGVLAVCIVLLAAPSVIEIGFPPPAIHDDSPIRQIADIPPGGTLKDLGAWTLQHPGNAAKYFLSAAAATAIAPFAWMVPGIVPGATFNPMTISFPGMWMWYSLLPFALLGVVSAMRRSKGEYLPHLLFAVAIFLLVVYVIPIESRHRNMIMPFALILSAEGLVYLRKYWQLAWLVWIPLIGFMAWKLNIVSVALILAAAGALAFGVYGLIRKRREKEALEAGS